MKQFSRDTWLTLGLLVVLIFITVVAAIQQTQNQLDPPLASFSSQPTGAKALQLWLTELGYQVSDETLTTFDVPSETDLLLLLEPSLNITELEWQLIDKWVEEGGTLFIVGNESGTGVAFRHYNFRLQYQVNESEPLFSQVPLWQSPPLIDPVPVNTLAYFSSTRTDYITHLAVEEGPVIVSFQEEAGQVILSAAPFPFSNAGLKSQGNPQLILNLLSHIKPEDKIWFDEWHHGIKSLKADVVGPGNWLRYTPAGQSLLYVVAIIFIGLILQGRLFGRPLPITQNTHRRSPLEYVSAIANLNRRAGHRNAVLKQYYHHLKRQLGYRYRLNPTLDDATYTKQLAQFNPAIDAVALQALLTRLQHPTVNESEMIELANQVAEWTMEH